MTPRTVECEDCGRQLDAPTRYHDAGGNPLCVGCWEDRYGEGGIDLDDDEDIDDPRYCVACGRPSDCLMNDLCGMCYELQGGVRLPGQ
jgi:NMD protein affecting ribosome stability and mRNA decay